MLGKAIGQPVRWHRSSSGSPSFSSSLAVVPMDTQDYDLSGGQYSNSSGEITVPAAGAYLTVVQATGTIESETYDLVTWVGHNGGATGDGTVSVNLGQNTVAQATAIVDCAKGDTLSLMTQLLGSYSSVPLVVTGTPPGNSITILRVG